jgi:hypothetical protein
MQTHPHHFHRWLGATMVLFCLLGGVAFAQTSSDDSATLHHILERLDRLEQQNRDLTVEVGALRKELAQARNAPEGAPAGAETAKAEPAAGIPERMDVEERRVEEMAQTKVESSQHFPIRITGMALFNSYINSNSGAPDVPMLIQPGGPLTGGATVRQTVLGLDYQGPEIFGNGKIHGFLSMDFFGATSDQYGGSMRIRTAGIEFNWADTSVMVGQDKPLISPREPNSLAEVWVAPLADSGNLWVWQPQLRAEQRFHLNDSTTLRAQASLFETRESYGGIAPAYGSIQASRPSVQGRIALAHNFDDSRRIEFGSGFGSSTTHIAETTVPSRVFTLDWLAIPWRKLEFSGEFFRGQDVSNLGGAGIGYTVMSPYSVIPVHADGGWAQFSFLATPRLTFNLFGGEQQNRGSDLGWGDVAKNQTYGGNVMYRIAPNVIISLESEQQRSEYMGTGRPLNNHYDLGVAYLF